MVVAADAVRPIEDWARGRYLNCQSNAQPQQREEHEQYKGEQKISASLHVLLLYRQTKSFVYGDGRIPPKECARLGNIDLQITAQTLHRITLA